MTFLNEAVRREFHLLPVERQKALTDCDDRFAERELELKIMLIEIIDSKTSEITVQVNPIAL